MPPAAPAPGPSGPGSGAVIHLPSSLRFAAFELADVPRPGDVEREEAFAEFVPDVRDLGVAHHRCPVACRNMFA